MPICKNCGEDKMILSFPFVCKDRKYSDTCKDCRTFKRRNGENEKLRRTWDALKGFDGFRYKKRKRL